MKSLYHFITRNKYGFKLTKNTILKYLPLKINIKIIKMLYKEGYILTFF
jgi:hypothetical protein